MNHCTKLKLFNITVHYLKLLFLTFNYNSNELFQHLIHSLKFKKNQVLQ